MTAIFPHWRILHGERLKAIVPASLKDILRKRIDNIEYQIEECRCIAERLYGGPIPNRSSYEPRHDLRVGIIRDRAYYYVYNVRACTDLGVPYEIIDIEGGDWIDVVRQSNVDIYLVWPSTLLSIWKQLYDERLTIMVRTLDKRIFPTLDEIWLLESKRRVREWLVSHGIPHPATRIFYDESAAREWAAESRLPVVCKTDNGAGGGGVFVLRSRRQVVGMVRHAFSRGLVTRRGDARDRQWGYILFQEYVPHEYEWRIVRIGDDFLCRRKTRVGDHASGSGEIGWASPETEMLNFVKSVTDAGGFRSMAVDVFKNPNEGSPFLVNELQCLFGAIQHESDVNEATGAWRLEGGHWVFRSGYYYQNACANLRVQWLLQNR